MKKAIPIIIAVVVVIGIAVGVIIHKQSNKIIFNTGYSNGNTAGNLYNNGTFCEHNGKVYFSNPDDNGKLYSMDANGSNVTKICDDVARFINADDHYLYYIRDNSGEGFDNSFFNYNCYSLCRVDQDGGKAVILDEDPCLYAALVGNYIYYLHYDTEDATTLYSIRIDGKEKQQVMDQYIYTCSVLDQYIYYTSSANGSLMRLDTTTNTSTTVLGCNCYKPIVTSENNVYYMDVSQDNALVHNSINSDMPTVLSSDSLDHFNVYGSYIYYQVYDKDSPKLCMIKNDGSGYREIKNGSFMSINVTSNNIYFTDYYSGTVYYTSLSNPGFVDTFHPGTGEE